VKGWAIERAAALLELRGPVGIATSATYERGAHIVDPRAARPTTSLASVTVVGPDLGRADAFATAAYVMGTDSLAWIEEQSDYDLYLVTHDGTTH
jgi:thiamine biosynthesis lipoprotein